MTELSIGMRGDYVMPAIPPYFGELRVPSTLERIQPDGSILLKDDTMPNYYVHTSAESFVPHGT